ncbi:acyltransferase [Flavobacterium ginsenosidimutans]|nr:acyltransferase [Flavobacterium ginsenosidimutans]
MQKLNRKIVNLFWKLYCYKVLKAICRKGDNIDIKLPITIVNPKNLTLHSDTYIGPEAWISAHANVEFDSGVIIGPRLKIYTANHNYLNDVAIPYDGVTILKKVTIGKNTWIGGDVIILPGINIGEGVVVGGGSVVTKNIPDHAIVGGNPAQIIKYRDVELYNKLKEEDKIYLKLKTNNKIDFSTKYD